MCTHSAVTGSEPDRGLERRKTSYSKLKQSPVSCSYGKDILFKSIRSEGKALEFDHCVQIEHTEEKHNVQTEENR